MSNIGKTLNAVMKEYLDEDEDIVKKVKKQGRRITFVFDMIDDELVVTINILQNNEYEIIHGKVNKKVTGTSFKTLLKTLMDDLSEARDKKIEFYNSMETPGPGGSPFDGGDTAFDSDDDEVEEEGEDMILTMEKGDIGMIGGMGSDMENIMLLREAPYEIRTPRQLIEMQGEVIGKISETMFVSEAGSKIILRAYRWDQERIINTFLKSGKDVVLQDVGLSSSKFEKKDSGEHDPSDEFECPSCYDDVLYKETLMMDSCGHRFCNDCWEEHLTYKIKDGLSKRILCMGSGCQCVVGENVVSSFISDDVVKKKYDTKILESFVEDNDSMKWCQSAPHCGNAVMVRVSNKTPLEIHCMCNKIFCFACLDEAHNPCSCKMLQAWRKKCADDSETLNWIKSNTRDCPKCGKATEKNGGCNHVSCTCGGHWCWACGGDFDTRTVYNHNCNKFLEKGGDGGQNDTRAVLERYLHYFNHYNAHHTSFKNQKKMEQKVDQKIRKMYQSRPNSAWVEIEWLKKGLNVLFDTRRALMHSYVFAYYLFDKALPSKLKKELHKGCQKFRTDKDRVRAKNLFEDTQEQLEHTTEELNKYLDMPLDKILQTSTKKEIMSKSVLNEKRVHGLFDVIRKEMVIEGEYKLPDPRFIVTTPSYERDNLSKAQGFRPTQQPQMKRLPPDSRDGMQKAIDASLMEDEDAQMQQAIQRSLDER